jgi:hypothetical protein
MVPTFTPVQDLARTVNSLSGSNGEVFFLLSYGLQLMVQIGIFLNFPSKVLKLFLRQSTSQMMDKR